MDKGHYVSIFEGAHGGEHLRRRVSIFEGALSIFDKTPNVLTSLSEHLRPRPVEPAPPQPPHPCIFLCPAPTPARRCCGQKLVWSRAGCMGRLSYSVVV